jgi:flagellar biosynthesis/type III secretory pathway protein FliH
MEKGMEKGLQQGLAQGVKLGIEQGINIGEQKGDKFRQFKMARKLLSKNFDMESIIEYTELTRDEIEGLSAGA